MVDLGPFLNGFVTDVPTFWMVAGGLVIVLALFSVTFDRWMDDLGEKKAGYTALLVVLGCAVTLIAVAVLSWKAAVLVSGAFIASGAAMIAGDIRRGHAEREQAARVNHPRRKALPYAACALIDDAIMLLSQVERSMKALLESKLDDRKTGLMALAVKDASIKLLEARKVEGE